MKNMQKINVVMLHLGEEQYPQEYLDNVAGELREQVGKMDCNLMGSYKIMCFADAEQVVEALKGKQVDLFILNFLSWHITPYVMHLLKDYRQTPLLIWGIGGTTDSTGKLHSPAAAAGITGFMPIAKEFGFKYKLILEKPDSKHEYAQVADYIHSVACAKTVRASRIGLIGYADMGLYPLSYDKKALFKKLGIDIEDYSGYEIANLMELFSEEKVKETMDWIRATTKAQNTISDKALEKVTRLYLAMKDKSDGRNLDAIAVKCVNGITKLGFNPCLAQSLLADKDVSVICECDAYGLVTSIILSTVTGNASAFVEHYEVFDKEILVGVCGFIPKDFIDGDFKIKASNLGEYNTGISNVSKMKTGEVTYGRFYNENGQFKLFLAHGNTKPNPKWTELGWAEPTPDFPAVMLEIEMPMQKYLEDVPGQHVIMVYGDYVEKVKTVCDLLDIEVVQ
ncbi:MAG: hypothetical protein E7454_08165 [Ruminococcaceae bacterium]|nr:hypothetical protein [Oscillospiraceae bacterium]